MEFPEPGRPRNAFSQNAAAVAAPLYARSRALAYCDTANVSHVSMLGSSVREDGETLDLVMVMRFLFHPGAGAFLSSPYGTQPETLLDRAGRSVWGRNGSMWMRTSGLSMWEGTVHAITQTGAATIFPIS